jgi:hypothetical protein
MALLEFQCLQDGIPGIDIYVPGLVVGDDLMRGLPVDRPPGFPSQIDAQFLGYLGAYHSLTGVPQLLHQCPCALVLHACRGIGRVHQNMGVHEVSIAHKARLATWEGSNEGPDPIEDG